MKTEMMLRGKKGDVRMQEMAFVLLAIVLLLAIVFIFSIRLQSSKFSEAVSEANEQRALSLRDKIAALPELKCAQKSCIDQDKAEILKNYDLSDQFQGLAAARIVKVYPESGEIILYRSSKAVNASYSTFVNLCRQESVGGAFAYDCGLALLVVSV